MYLPISRLQKCTDIQEYFSGLNKNITSKERIVIDLKKNNYLFNSIDNWLTRSDIEYFLQLTGFEVISTNRARIIARKVNTPKVRSRYSVSIIIPAKNEEQNVLRILPKMPRFGKSQEFVFVEGGSKDKTWENIIKVKDKNKNRKIKIYKQLGVGKANAVHLGLSKAAGDILIIYDADMTIDPKELKKFYECLSSNKGEFINGSRLVYPMEKDAMQTLNKIGNIIFSNLFTFVLGQKFKDTLCGTKALFRKDYLNIRKYIKKHKTVDPFADFDLIFGAIRLNLKVVEIPVHYKERVYGTTNIRRFYHGILLLKMLIWAILEFKFSQRQDTQ